MSPRYSSLVLQRRETLPLPGNGRCQFAETVVSSAAANSPKPSSLLPPPQSCPDFKRLTPCIKKIVGHQQFNRTIDSSCCATIVDISDKCNQIKPSWLSQSRDYCHQSV
ncbi:hypothetical protein L484_019579 [Morus notabilis]|uniref:Prolamin-like domain-containing protein n=1 Tax=Morus notabilis TaxID=981085 RepID=W9RVT4_9ROSA|nr:hypothetical protein L484_019579 [Morus notabilis]